MHDVGIYENLILGIHFLLLKKCKIFDEKTIVRCYTGRSMRIKVRKHERRGYQSIKMSNILEKQFLKQRNDFATVFLLSEKILRWKQVEV